MLELHLKVTQRHKQAMVLQTDGTRISITGSSNQVTI